MPRDLVAAKPLDYDRGRPSLPSRAFLPGMLVLDALESVAGFCIRLFWPSDPVQTFLHHKWEESTSATAYIFEVN